MQTLDVEARGWALANRQVLVLRRARRRLEEVLNRLAINLKKRDLHGDVDIGVAPREVEHVGERVRDDARVLVLDTVQDAHRVRLARARLAVREDRTVVACQHGAHDRSRDRVVHLVLGRLGAERVVETEISRLRRSRAQLHQPHLTFLGRGRQNHDRSETLLSLLLLLHLLAERRAAPDADANPTRLR